MPVKLLGCVPYHRVRVTPSNVPLEQNLRSFEFETRGDILSELETQVVSAILDSEKPSIFINEDAFLSAMQERIMYALLFSPLPQQLRIDSIQLEKFTRKNEQVWRLQTLCHEPSDFHRCILGYIRYEETSALR